MKKLLLTSVLVSLLILPVIGLTQAVPIETAPKLNPIQVIERIIDVVFTILLIFAALMIIVAAYLFISAQGDPEKVKTARNFVLYAVIGVIVAFLARGLIWLVRTIMPPPVG